MHPADTENINYCVGTWRGIPLPYLKKIARLNNYVRKADAAKKLHKILQDFANEYGYMAEDVSYRPPEDAKYYTSAAHCVSFEGGPHEWGVCLSFLLSNENWYTEPYHAFDVHFYDSGR